MIEHVVLAVTVGAVITGAYLVRKRARVDAGRALLADLARMRDARALGEGRVAIPSRGIEVACSVDRLRYTSDPSAAAVVEAPWALGGGLRFKLRPPLPLDAALHVRFRLDARIDQRSVLTADDPEIVDVLRLHRGEILALGRGLELEADEARVVGRLPLSGRGDRAAVGKLVSLVAAVASVGLAPLREIAERLGGSLVLTPGSPAAVHVGSSAGEVLIESSEGALAAVRGATAITARISGERTLPVFECTGAGARLEPAPPSGALGDPRALEHAAAAGTFALVCDGSAVAIAWAERPTDGELRAGIELVAAIAKSLRSEGAFR